MKRVLRATARDSVESSFCDQILYRWVRRFPSNEGIKEGYPLRNRYFTSN